MSASYRRRENLLWPVRIYQLVEGGICVNAQAQTISVKTLCLTAILAAFVFLMTFVPKIPIPLGYAHLGDAVIYLLVLFIGRREACLAAAVGSALADLMGGFPVWIIPTLFIKWIMVEIVFWIIRPDQVTCTVLSVRTFLAFFLSSAWMVIAYTVAGAVLYSSIASALPMIPGLIGEGAINMVAAFAAGMALRHLPNSRAV